MNPKRTATQPTLGSRLRVARLARGLTLETVAEKISSDAGSLSRIERDKRDPTMPQLRQLAALYGTTRSALLDGLDPPVHARKFARTGT